MKTITNRTEIATIINSRSMPVVRLDIANASEFSLGKTIVTFKWEHNGNTWYKECTLSYYSNEREDGGLTFSNGGTCLHSSFGYGDIEELLANNAAPCVEVGKEFMLVIVNSKVKANFPPMILKMDKTMDINCMEPIKVCKEDAEAFNKEFGFIFDKIIAK